MSVRTSTFGYQRAIFANQDDGIFSAIPITLDDTVLTLETFTENNRKFVKAGSVVKHGSTVKGITAEEYEITYGPINGRVVLEGYVYVERLTEAAVEAMALLPKIVPIPYGKILFNPLYALGTDVFIRVSGSAWKSTVAIGNFTVVDSGTGAILAAVERDANDNSLVKLTFAEAVEDAGIEDGTLEITAINSTAVVSATGKVVDGLPITITFINGEVCLNA